MAQKTHNQWSLSAKKLPLQCFLKLIQMLTNMQNSSKTTLSSKTPKDVTIL